MPTQSYETHRHLPRPTVFAALFVLIALGSFVVGAFGVASATQIGLFALTFAVFALVAMSRTYITALQDRIIRLEMRLRAERVLSPAHAAALVRLTKAQMIALRFASDEELPALIERTERESLTPDQIKRAIKVWVPDFDRT